jgi:hypothetical protein
MKPPQTISSDKRCHIAKSFANCGFAFDTMSTHIAEVEEHPKE